MTLQTTTPIRELTATNSNRPCSFFRVYAGEDEDGPGSTSLDLDAPYQRGDVWGPTRRRELIRSLLMSVPIGAIVMNQRLESGRWSGRPFAHYSGAEEYRNWAYAVIDGKQRVTTMLMWLRGELDLPASWFPEEDVLSTHETDDGSYVFIGELAARQRRGFENIPVATCEARVSTMAAEEEIFRLINFGGLLQGEVDEQGEDR